MKVLTVSELTFAIKGLLEPHFRAICVKGEISNCKAQSSGHLYFTLKDSGSQISAVLFRGNSGGLTRTPKEGDQVIVIGELSLYPPRGQYQMIVREIQFAGIGELLLQFQKRKETLQARGWFDPQWKKALPKLPRTIGVVTSPTGAVIQDIIHVLKRRFAGFHLILRPVKVQGEGAAEEIAEAIQDFNASGNVDVLIVGRGGGSIEDLWAFNEEIVAKAIFESKIPIISAVGHETDFTIADWVADLRAPTPSAAAEMVIAEKMGLLKMLMHMEQHIGGRLFAQVRQEKHRLQAIYRHPLFSTPYALLSSPIQQLDGFKASFERLKPLNRIAEWKKSLQLYRDRFAMAIASDIEKKKERLSRLKQHVTSIHPKNLLNKGYSMLFFEKSSSLILSVKDVAIEQKVTMHLSDGRFVAKICEIEAYER